MPSTTTQPQDSVTREVRQPEFHNYNGEWEEHYVRGRSLSTFHTDVSGTIDYRFDRFGFRSPPWDRPGSRAIYVAGCSYTFGHGLALSQTWPALLRASHEVECGIPLNLANFAQGGASNDYISRMLLSQSEVRRPDIIVSLYSHRCRAEYLSRELSPREHALGPWSLDDSLDQAYRQCEEMAEPYYAYYSDEIGTASFLRNALLLQNYSQAHGITYLWSWVEAEFLDAANLREDHALAPLLRMLDMSRFVPFAKAPYLDIAADGVHPGPECHKVFARALVERLTQLDALHPSSDRPGR